MHSIPKQATLPRVVLAPRVPCGEHFAVGLGSGLVYLFRLP